MLNMLYTIKFGYFFNTDKGHFNWVFVTSIVAICTFIWTIWFNSKKYKADLVSKTRIEWLQEIRELYGKYIEAIVGVFDGKKGKMYASIADVKHYQLELFTYFGIESNKDIFYSKEQEKILGLKNNTEATTLNISSLLIALTDETMFLASKISQLPRYDNDKKIKQKFSFSGNINPELEKKIMEGNKVSARIETSNKDIEVITLDGTLLDNEYAKELESNLNMFTKMITEYLDEQWQKAQKGR